MHSYSISPSSKRKNVTFIIFFIAVFLYVVVRMYRIEEYFYNIIDAATKGVMSDNSLTLDALKYAFSIIFPISFYELLRWIYSNWFWKVCHKIHKIPDLSGTWEGEIEHGYIIVHENENIDNCDKKGKTKIAVKIKQNWDKISIATDTNNYIANSKFAEIRIDDNGNVYLKYVFDCYEKKLGEKKYHQGYNELLFRCEKNEGGKFTLEGEYFTNRNAALKGDMKYYNKKIKKVGKGFGTKGYISYIRIKH